MGNEKIFINVLNFIPDKIVQKRKIKLSISEKDLDKYIDEHVYTDASIFNEIDLNTGDTIIYKGKVYIAFFYGKSGTNYGGIFYVDDI